MHHYSIGKPPYLNIEQRFSRFLFISYHFQCLFIVEALHDSLASINEPVVDLVNCKLGLLRHLRLLRMRGVGIRKVLQQPLLQDEGRLDRNLAVLAFAIVVLADFRTQLFVLYAMRVIVPSLVRVAYRKSACQLFSIEFVR